MPAWSKFEDIKVIMCYIIPINIHKEKISLEKHPIDSLIQKEDKLLRDIENYLESLVQGDYECFRAEKLLGGRYMISITLDSIRLITSYIVTIQEVFETAAKTKWDTAEDVILQYLRDRIEEDVIAWFNGEFDEDKQEKDSLR